MKSENIFEAIGEIDEKLIAQADGYSLNKKKKNIIPYIVSVAAVLAIAVTGGVLHSNGFFDRVGLFTSETTQENVNIQADSSSESTSENTSELPSETSTDSHLVPPENTTEPPFKPQSPSVLPMRLTSVSYPSRAQFPLMTGDSFEYSEAYYSEFKAWRNQQKEIRSISADTSNLAFFTKAIYGEFLTEKNGENKLISPISLYVCLSMLAETSDGNTRQQILKLMGVDSIEELRLQVNALWQKGYLNDGVNKSIISNSLWLSEDIAYKNPLVDTLSSSYFASSFIGKMGSDDYNKMLNDWLYESTDGMLSPEESLSEDNVFALVSSVVFRSKWENEFEPSATEKGTFLSPSGEKQVDFMKKSCVDYYYWGENYSAVNMSLVTGKMWFILPDEDVSAESLFEDSEVLSLISTGNGDNKQVIVNMSVPRFDVTGNTDILEGLQNLGLTDMTNPGKADFSPLCENSDGVHISGATQNVRVSADEEGVAAAAYTMISGAGGTMPPDDYVDFVLDRPFIFVIELNGIPMFSGVVNNP